MRDLHRGYSLLIKPGQPRKGRFFFLRGLIVFILIFGSPVRPANANVFNSGDVSPITHVVRLLLQLMQDINSAARGARGQSQECLITMTSDVAEIHDEFQKIEEILYLSTRMQLAEDEEVIIGTLLIDFVYTKKRLVLQRQAVNLSAGVCGGSSLVSEKSREALRLFSQANNIIELLEAKLMRSR